MAFKHWLCGAGVLLLAIGVKAHMLFIKLVILAAAGLAGLFLLHTLAQDYRKIQANRPKAFGLFKRSIETSTETLLGPDMDSAFSEAHRQIEELQKANLLESNELSVLGAATYLDPQGCARRYICTIATRPKESLTSIERAILQLVQKGPKDAAAFREAAYIGRKSQDAKYCRATYQRCSFSITEMLRLIQPVY